MNMDRKLMEGIKRLISPLERRIKLVVGRCVLTAINDSKKMQLNQISVMAGEAYEGVERFQEYGFTSVPLPSCEAIALFHSGNRENGVVIATDDRRYRLKDLGAGDVALYTDKGDFIKISSADRKVSIQSEEAWQLDTKEVIVNAENATVTATSDVSITCENANIVANTKGIIDSPAVEIGRGALESVVNGETFKDFFNSHTHVSASPGGSSSPPTAPMGPAQLSTIVKAAK